MTFELIVTDEEHEYEILRRMTPGTHKIGVPIIADLSAEQQFALERLQLRDWVRLIDVSVASGVPGHLLRIFRVMPAAVAWFQVYEKESRKKIL